MGRAERETARRERAQAAQRSAVDRGRVQRVESRLQSTAAEIQTLVPRALAALEAAGWPDGRMIELYKAFGKHKAGWLVGHYNTNMHGEHGTRALYLLSNGKFGAPGTATESAAQAARAIGVVEGLRGLIAKYERRP